MKSSFIPLGAMTVIVVASNWLVQFPINDLLTWGAITYPFSFLVTDLTTRLQGAGARAARRVWAGFALAVLLSIWLATPRIALASGTAFLAGQLLDIQVFQRLRAGSWWRAPLGELHRGLGRRCPALFFSLCLRRLWMAVDHPGSRRSRRESHSGGGWRWPRSAPFWPCRYRSARPGSEAGHPHCVKSDLLARLEQRLGPLHARQRLGIETDHELRVFGGAQFLSHRELVFDPCVHSHQPASDRPLSARRAQRRPGRAPNNDRSPAIARRLRRLHPPASQRPARGHEPRGDAAWSN